ncbi:heavy metal sensor histidine kinase [Pseudomonas sp. TTU2014-080ASC]|uniref:heavy metal sensor histidine kinase n=1 Tax=Pseudomonas sp. TTU2014-080ASC TaxID=1729724 RepID=UPI00071896E5|nr:heavy metal sensor histidine kinase [Pseudomonas sp. TTU2014-080ASC]KRW62509.1 histidine kinase [Pseudomonas sp. TTU2014-080ASC]
MKPASLSARLGLSVALMGAAIVVLLAGLAYFSLSRELSLHAKNTLTGKLEQVQHRLEEDRLTRADIISQPHHLIDIVAGHDNLQLDIYESGDVGRSLLSMTNASKVPKPSYIGGQPQLLEWLDGTRRNFMTLGQDVRLQDGSEVTLQLSIDRTMDEVLLTAFLRSSLIALPFLVLFIGLGGWWIVQGGLAPLRNFRKVAARVTTQDLAHRLETDGLPLELSELAFSINYMLGRLDSGVQELSQFSDDLAHELRSPISNLMGKAQVTLSRERPPEEYKAVLESCTEELERISRIVSDMLFLAQAGQPISLTSFSRISLGDEARQVADLFSISAEDKQVDIKLSGDGIIIGERLMVQRAISNLLSNAIRHSHVESVIWVNIQEQAGKVVLSVSNPGVGIPAQHLPHLFERFYRVDASRSRAEGGTGLGLAIVHSIMNVHQGAVEVSSELAGITTFRLLFPAHHQKQLENQVRSQQR